MNTNKTSGGRSWAWGITGTYVAFAGMTLTMVFVAFSQNTDLVSEDYYQREIDHQQHMDRVARTQSLPNGVVWSFGHEEGALILHFPPGHFDDGPTGSVQLYRPDNASLDQTHDIGLDDSGHQRIALAGLVSGRWHILIEWQADGKHYFSERQLQVGA